MYYTIYKITNQINGKFYIGSHKTKDLNDGYMGSGKYLNHAYKKYGLENFSKEILFVFDTPEEMYAKEAEIVNDEFLAEENTYNLKRGGFGGWDYINNDKTLIQQRNKKVANIRDNSHGNLIRAIARQTKEYKEKQKQGLKKYFENNSGSFLGKTHSDKTKSIMSDKAKERLKDPTKNSQYGTTWVWCPSLGNKKIKKEELEHYLESGWIKAYKPKYIPDNQNGLKSLL